MGVELFIGVGGFIITIIVVTASAVWQAGLLKNHITELKGEIKLIEQRSEARLQKAMGILKEDIDTRLDNMSVDINELKYRVTSLEKKK